MKAKKLTKLIFIGMLMLLTVTGCGKSGFDANRDITVISREDGSGTRGAFVELFGIEQKNESGTKIDKTIETADITQSTGVMITSVSQNTSAIGYISLGSMNDEVKALKIDNTDATVENIKSGSYKIARPFNIVTKDNLSQVAKDFIDFIMSSDGQKIVEDSGYISSSDKEAYAGSKPSGKVAIAGSSSVSPVMEKLKEAYLAINPNAVIEINQSDSTTGINSVINDICEIGMASRELKDSEKAAGLTSTAIAIDGIAVIVNKENIVDNLTIEQVRKIYTGEFTKWLDVID
ncbi:MAG: substrate-binding domain-containing protein [Eubacteriales bacterium]|nr:substrate-binding domain-containing protein [Eubacteriales bacterium]